MPRGTKDFPERYSGVSSMQYGERARAYQKQSIDEWSPLVMAVTRKG